MPPAQTDDQAKFRRHLLLWLLLGFVLLVGFLILQRFLNRASIEVVVEDAGRGEITYRFENQDNQDVTEIKDAATRIKQTLAKGSYEINISQAGSSYFSVAEVSESGKKVTAKLEVEKGRRFIGNQPGSCMFVKDGVLLSYQCGGGVADLKTHMPATDSLPTLTKPTLDGGENIIEGLVRTNANQDILLVREAAEAGHEDYSGGFSSPHTAFLMTGNPASGKVQLPDRVTMDDLEGQYSYGLVAYKNGFIAYNDQLSHVLYYESLTARPKELKLQDLSDERLRPQALRVLDEAYAVTYTGGSDQTTVIVYKDGRPKRYDFEQGLSSVRLCGDKLLCVLAERALEVYSIDGEEPRLRYRVANVTAIENSGSERLLVITKQGVLNVDAANGSGVFQYRFGAYRFCGISPTGDSYVVCVANRKGVQSVLLIEQNQVSDGIDQKILKLSDLPQIRTLSIYGASIFISPVTGKVEFDPAQQGYVYDQKVIKDSNAKINKKIEELNIDQNIYRIRNSFDD